MLDTLLSVCTAIETSLLAVLVGWVLWDEWLAGRSASSATRDWAWLLLLLLQPINFGLWTSDIGYSIGSIPVMLTHTHYGHAAIIRFASIVLMSSKCLPWGRNHALAWVLVLTTIFAWTRSIVSHAGETGNFNVHVLADTAHLVAITTWTGGVIVAAWQRQLQIDKKPQEFALSVRRLSSLAAGFLVIASITGPYMAVNLIGHPLDLILTPYGKLLDFKLALVSMVLVAAAFSRFVLLPQLVDVGAASAPNEVLAPIVNSSRHSIRSVSRRTPPVVLLHRVLRVESLLLLAVIVVASALRNTNPPMVM